MLQVHEGVAHLFRLLLQPPTRTKIFIPTIEQSLNRSDYRKNLRDVNISQPFTMNHLLVSGISKTENLFTKYQEQIKEEYSYGYSSHSEKITERVEITIAEQLQLIKARGKFHYAFGTPPVHDDATPITSEDIMRDWRVSSGNKKRQAHLHLMCLESMITALVPGGYAGAVLPARWIGKEMKYNRWWNEHVATVARIALPAGAVTEWVNDNEELMAKVPSGNLSEIDLANYDHFLSAKVAPSYPGKWILAIFHKPVNPEETSKTNRLFFASLRYSAFIKSLPGLQPEHTEMVAKAFKRHDWWRYSIKAWNKFLNEVGSGVYNCGPYERPEILADPKEARVIKFSDKNLPGFKIAKNIDDIRGDNFGVHIKLGPPTKVYAYSLGAQAGLLDIRLRSGLIEESGGRGRRREVEMDDEEKEDKRREQLGLNPKVRPRDKFITRLRQRSFAENRDWLLKTLQEAGLTPYLLESEVRRMECMERWLNIQLAPIRRTVKVPEVVDEIQDEKDKALDQLSDELFNQGEAVANNPEKVSTGNKSEPTPEPDSDIKISNHATWETLYEDACLEAAFPEVYKLWESRAKKMRMDTLEIIVRGKKQRLTFDFQFNDIIEMCTKQCVLNGNHMGLGKTREVLLSLILLGVESCLIILPTKLIGVWQEELETTIANYARIIRRNWMGKLINADYQVIEWAEQCQPQKLATFNIISYENLARIPKDARFFKCPACEYIACSLSPFVDVLACPECNHKRTQKTKEINRKKGLKKQKINIGTKEAPKIEISDDRVSSRNLVMMVPLDHQMKKMQKIVKQRHYKNQQTGEHDIQNYIEYEERKPHLRWTFSHLLRQLRFNTVLIDEADYIKNPSSQRSTALNKITGRRRISLSGTPISGYPKTIVNVLNWTFKRDVFPDYRSANGNATGTRKFEKKYGTYIQREGSTAKLLPKVNNPELFQSEVAPLMLRHTRFEPAVAKDIPPKEAILDYEIIKMDDHHTAYYSKWLEVFAEWWKLKREEVDKQEGAKVVNDLLVKLGYLINVSAIPHFMLENALKATGEGAEWARMINVYTGPTTAKFNRCCQIFKENIKEEKKTMIFCFRTKNITLGRMWCKAQKPEIPVVWVDGSVTNEIKPGTNRSERQMRVDRFRFKDYSGMWCGIKSMAEGFNIPEASRAIFLDYTWEPRDFRQALGRMLRPAQKDVVKGVFLCHQGTVDEYMAALNLLKRRSADEAVDYEIFDDFTAGMVPDFMTYANSIVDGTQDTLTRKMWLAVEEMKKRIEDGDE